MTQEKTIKYVGDGLVIHGVPKRSLTPEEFETHRAAIEACPQLVYEVPKVEDKPKATTKKGKGE